MRTPTRAALIAATAAVLLAGCDDEAGDRQLIDEAEDTGTETVGDVATDPDIEPAPGETGTGTEG